MVEEVKVKEEGRERGGGLEGCLGKREGAKSKYLL